VFRAALVTGGFGLAGLVMGFVGRGVLRRSVLRMDCRPPWAELAAAGLAAVLGWRAAVGLLPWWWVPVPLLLGWFAVPLVAADVRHHRLPDVLTLSAYPALGLALAVAGTVDPGLALRSLAGVVVFGGAHALVRVLAPAALGGGDVKLAGSLGAVLGALGWPSLAVAAVLAGCCTALLAIGLRAGAAPHGPGLLAATWLVAAFPGGHLPAIG
jgi:leader peptidase (prepilin peptidase)/N-methyltransferase